MNQSKINAGGINQQTMNAVTATTANSININVQSINNQCALHQQTMRIAPDSLMPGFSRTKTFTLSSMPPIPVILRGAKGEVAESILSTKNPRPPGEEGLTQTMAEGPGSALIHHPSSALTGTFSQGIRFFLCFEMWMLQVRGNPVQTTDALGIESPGEE